MDMADEAATPLVLLALIVSFLPHATHLPPGLSGFCLLLWAAKAVLSKRGYGPPPRLVLIALALGVAAVIFMTYGRLLGHDSGVALLAALMGIKPLEIRTRRDQSVTLFLCLVLAATLAMFHNTLAGLTAMLGSLTLTTAVLCRIQVCRYTLFPALRLTGILLLQAVPLALMLFFLFPRLPGSLWGVPTQGTVGVSGLDREMRPGMVSRVVQSGEPAFRVEFDGPVPPRDQLYWRALVLWSYERGTWKVGAHPPPPLPVVMESEPIRHSVALEPHRMDILPALDFPVAAPRGSSFASGNVLASRRPVYKRVVYEVESVIAHRSLQFTSSEEQAGLAVDLGENPRAAAMAQEWRAGALAPREIVEQALDFLRTSGFAYTLSPPLLGSNPVDDFLFGTRQGFCEHFASSFTWLMRAAGVPARVVVGYQGGSFNDVGGFLLVRQSDAHAWSEVWLEPDGWTRVDPTAAASPERIDAGVEAVFPETGLGLPFMGLGQNRLLWRLRLRMDAMYHAWNQWIVYYDFSRQSSLLQDFRLGRDIWQALFPVIAVGMCAFLLYLTVAGLFLFRKKSPAMDPAHREYRRFLGKLRQAGIAPRDAEGPLALARRIEEELPDLSCEAHRICSLYARMRYGPESTAMERARLKHWVDAFPSAKAMNGSSSLRDGTPH
jgi:protein-glutamine gamma-glutamyltransferase